MANKNQCADHMQSREAGGLQGEPANMLDWKAPSANPSFNVENREKVTENDKG